VNELIIKRRSFAGKKGGDLVCEIAADRSEWMF